MFNAREFSKLGLTRASSKDFMENGISYRCYMYGDLRVFYYRHYENYYVFIKIPYQNYDFTYEDVKKENWFWQTSRWHGCTDFSAKGLMESLKAIREGIINVQSKVEKETIDTDVLDKAFKEEILAAKVTLKDFNKNMENLEDRNLINSDHLIYTANKLRKIINDPVKSYKDLTFREQRIAIQLLRKYGYINNEIHNCITILQESFSWDYGIII